MYKRLFIMLIVILLGGLLPDTGLAEGPSDPLRIVLVIDDSESMRYNDSQNLRLVAAKLFISLLEPQDQVAVIRFSSESEVLVPFTSLDPAAKQSLIHQLDQGFYSEGRTDIRAALSQAQTLLAEAAASQARVILLTDGSPSLPHWPLDNPPPEELGPYVEETLTGVKTMSQPVLTVALGSDIDRTFLEKIGQESQGHFFEARTALDLPAVYLEIISDLQDRALVPSELTAPDQVTFNISPFTQSVGFIIVKQPNLTARVYPPDAAEPLNLETPGVVTFSDPLFEVIILSDLTPGPWRVALSGPGQADVQAIVIRSQLQLELLAPVNGEACTGQPWQVQAGLSVIGPDGAINPIRGNKAPEPIVADITFPDGRLKTLMLPGEARGDKCCTFSAVFKAPDLPGTYRIVLHSLTRTGGLDIRHTTEITTRTCPEPAPVALEEAPSPQVTPTWIITVETDPVEDASASLDYPTSTPPAGEAEPDSGDQAGPQLVNPTPLDQLRESWRWLALITLGLLALFLLGYRFSRPRLEGELSFGLPGAKPEREPIQGPQVYLKVEEGDLTVSSHPRGAQALLRAEPQGHVRLRSLNGTILTRNNIPVRKEGCLLEPDDVIQLEGLEMRYENYKQVES